MIITCVVFFAAWRCPTVTHTYCKWKTKNQVSMSQWSNEINENALFCDCRLKCTGKFYIYSMCVVLCWESWVWIMKTWDVQFVLNKFFIFKVLETCLLGMCFVSNVSRNGLIQMFVHYAKKIYLTVSSVTWKWNIACNWWFGYIEKVVKNTFIIVKDKLGFHFTH